MIHSMDLYGTLHEYKYTGRLQSNLATPFYNPDIFSHFSIHVLYIIFITGMTYMNAIKYPVS